MMVFLQIPLANGRNEVRRLQATIEQLDVERDRVIQQFHGLQLNYEAIRARNGALSIRIEHLEKERAQMMGNNEDSLPGAAASGLAGGVVRTWDHPKRSRRRAILESIDDCWLPLRKAMVCREMVRQPGLRQATSLQIPQQTWETCFLKKTKAVPGMSDIAQASLRELLNIQQPSKWMHRHNHAAKVA